MDERKKYEKEIISKLRKDGFDVSFSAGKCVLRRYIKDGEEAHIPDEVDIIGECAFYDNKKIKRVYFGENITEIRTSAFEDCSSLEYVSDLENVSYIDHFAFSYTIKLSSVKLSDKLLFIGEYAFCGSGLTEIIIPDGVDNVQFKAFFACPKLEKAHISGNNAYYGESVFANCFHLKNLECTNGVSELDRRAFSYCKELETVIISSETTIGEDCFEAVECEIEYK
jgi:hypothetical protein